MSVSGSRPWLVVRRAADAASLHRPLSDRPPGRYVSLCRVSRPAVVLGSTQAEGVVDRRRAAAAGIDVARRRSGGGAVLVVPGQMAWAEVHIGPADPLWEADAGRAFLWLGDLWAAALAGLGVPAAEVHRGSLVTTPWSSLVCFGGLGPGEVTAGGVKVVGMSQRRTRDGSTFWCAALVGWEPGDLLQVLDLSPAQRVQASAFLRRASTGLRWLAGAPGELTAAGLEDAFVGQLSQVP